MVEINQPVIDTEYGEGYISDIFELGYFMVKFKEKKLLVMYDSKMKRFNNKKALQFDIDKNNESEGLFGEWIYFKAIYVAYRSFKKFF